MSELKQLPEPIDIDHQIENLKEIGLIVDDEDYARKILNDISYFRLVKAFSLKLKPKNGRYYNNVRFENISYVRNICAHYGRIYDAKLTKTPKLYDQYTKDGIGNNRIFATILCLKNIIDDSEHWNSFVDEMVGLVEKYNGVDVTTMGFPNDWKKYLVIDD